MYGWCVGIRGGSYFAFWPQRLRAIIATVEVWSMRSPWYAISSLTWRGREVIGVLASADQLNGDLVVASYSHTMDLGHLSRTAPAILTRCRKGAVVNCFERIEAMNKLHYGKQPSLIYTSSPDFYATVLIQASEDESACQAIVSILWQGSPFYCSKLAPKSFGRLLLALTTATTRLPPTSLSYRHALRLSSELLSLYPTNSEELPWELMQHGGFIISFLLRCDIGSLLAPLQSH